MTSMDYYLILPQFHMFILNQVLFKPLSLKYIRFDTCNTVI